MAKVDILDAEIRVFLPMKKGDVCLALIADLPMLFKGPTPMAVRQKADDWRRAEVERMERKGLRKAVQA